MRSNTATNEFFVGLVGLWQTLSKLSLSEASAMRRWTSEKAKLVRPFTLRRRWGSIRFDAVRINPSDRGRHHTKMQVIDHGLGIPTLTFLTANVLLELFKAGFDFPASAIILDDLCHRQFEIDSKQGDPLRFPKHPHTLTGISGSSA